ncbi:MAG TPA: protein phosphatase 2C domain-containing protein, partial [Deinococcales bacterium]|nr:protein phosphatase 2C domain-containing protein [Deinococcales bacterium]
MTAQPLPALELEVAGLSHLGQVRAVNEDAWAAERVGEQVLALVADGMGGHRAGEVASAIATDTLIGAYRSMGGTPYERLARAFQRANLAVFQQASRRAEARGMGTTLTCVLLDDQYL